MSTEHLQLDYSPLDDLRNSLLFENPIFWIDFYKAGHVQQYPKDIRRIWVNFTPRSTRVEGETGVIFFGLQHFIKKVLIEQFNRYFFLRPWSSIAQEYTEVIKATLGVQEPKLDHLHKLWLGGKLPIQIYALPEGTYVPLGCPAAVMVNTEPHAFWLPNYIETMMSNHIWGSSTSATTARRYRKIFEMHAKAAGETDLSFVDWQGHDFSYRGLMGLDAAKLSGMGHLLSFSGTDTLPAILEAVKYYGAPLSVGGSVPATEHSVMCAGSQEGEQETFRRLIEDVYPTGIVSIVSDTWNLWDVLTKIVPALRDKILARDGKVVIRPDSGDPIKILTGDDAAPVGSNEWRGAADLLRAALGASGEPTRGMINKGGLIYGDSITPERAHQILSRARAQHFSPYNFVFGIGSYTYQYVTRDTYNFAFKATAIEREVELPKTPFDAGLRGHVIEAIFKNPVTDNAHKKSHRGIPVVYADRCGGGIYYEETTNPELLDACAFRKVFQDSLLLVEDTFEDIRKRVRA